MSNDFTEREIDQSEKLIVRNQRSQKVEKVIFPHNTQVGLEDTRYQANLTVRLKSTKNIRHISIAPLMGDAIKRINTDTSVSALFD